MARKASALTLAIRSLCQQYGGDLTHSAARPMLKAMKIAIAPEPGPKSEDYLQWEPHSKKFVYPSVKDLNEDTLAAYYEATCREAGLPPRKFSAIQAEDQVQRAFTNEQNGFDQTKFLWKRTQANGPSMKPVTNVNVKSKASTVVHKPKAAKPVVVGKPGDMTKALEAVSQIVKVGGVQAVKAKIAALNAEVAQLTALLEAAAPVQESLSDAA